MKEPITYQLVKSFSKEEYKFFLRVLTKDKKANVLRELYVYLYHSKNLHDLKVGRNQLSDTTRKYFAQYCLKLNTHILNFLKQNEKNNDEVLLLGYIETTTILLNRRLFSIAERYIQKALEMVKQPSLMRYFPIVNYQQVILFNKDYRRQKPIKSERLLKQLDVVAKYDAHQTFLRNETARKLREYSSKILPQKIYDTKKSKLKYEWNSPIDLDFIQNHHLLLVDNYMLEAVKLINETDWKNALEKFYNILILFADNGTNSLLEKEMYWASITNSLLCMNKSKDFRYFKAVLELVAESISTVEQQLGYQAGLHKKLHANVSILYAYNTMGNISEGKNFVARILSIIKEENLSDITTLMPYAYYHIAFHYYLSGDFETCLDWVNKTYSKISQKKKGKYFFSSRVLELLVYSELKNIGLMNSLWHSFNRGKWVVKRDKKIEKILRRILLDEVDPTKKPLSEKQYNEMLLDLKSMPHSVYYFDSFDFMALVRAKKEKMELKDALESNFIK